MVALRKRQAPAPSHAELRRVVWDFRQRPEIAQAWPAPDLLDSLRFAACEAAEAVDAQLRQNKTYVRNREDEASIQDELADCAMMLITAWGPGPRAENGVFNPHRWMLASVHGQDPLVGILLTVTTALGDYLRGTPCWPMVRLALHMIANYPDLDLGARVAARLARIEEKHVR